MNNKNPVVLTVDEYHFMWGLLALQDPNAEKLMRLSAPQVGVAFFPDRYTHFEALRLGLKYQRFSEECDHPLSTAAKKTENPVPDMDEFSEGRLKGLSDPRLSDEDLSIAGALEMDDAIPRLYRRVTSSLPESKTFRQEYAKKLDTFAEIIEENGLLITTAQGEDIGRPLLFARVEKNLCAMVITMGIAHQRYIENALDLGSRPKDAPSFFTNIKPDIQSN